MFKRIGGRPRSPSPNYNLNDNMPQINSSQSQTEDHGIRTHLVVTEKMLMQLMNNNPLAKDMGVDMNALKREDVFTLNMWRYVGRKRPY